MKHSLGKLFDFENLFLNDGMVLDFIKLFQISEVALAPGGQIFEHKQYCNEISYIVSGSALFYTNDTAFNVAKGDIHVISGGDRHKIVAGNCEKMRYICLGFDFANVPEKYKNVCGFYGASPMYVQKSGGDIRQLFDMLVNEFYENSQMQMYTAENIIKLILIKVFLLFEKNSKNEDLKKNITLKNITLFQIIKYIDANIYKVKTVREAALALNFNESYVSHIFKREMGISLLSYIKQKKLEAAKNLIEKKKMSITEISQILNFDSPQSLSRAFKKEFGKTPTQYRYMDK